MAQPISAHSYPDNAPVTLTICCVTFNHEAYLAQCLDGILEQRCDFRVEVIVHDDASTDDTAQIIRDYAARYPQIIKPILQSHNMYSKGVNAQYSFVFPASQGDFMAICDGDDFWSDPEKLARQVAVLQNEPDVSLTYGRVRAVSETGEITEEYVGGQERDLSSDDLKLGRPINTVTACFRNIFKGQTPPEFLRSSPIGDLTLWAQLGYHGRGKFLPEMPKANYRRHSGGVMSMQNTSQQVSMALVAQASIAVHHKLRGDEAAFHAGARRVMKLTNSLGGGGYLERRLDKISLPSLLAMWWKARRR